MTPNQLSHTSKGLDKDFLKIILALTVWLIWLGIVLQSKRALVQFPFGVHAWVVCLVPEWGMYKRQQQIHVFLSH